MCIFERLRFRTYASREPHRAGSRKDWRLKNILVATDFSERSDRAIRRATLLAREFAASVAMVHSVDDDQPQPLIDNEREIAEKLLDEQARSLREIDGVA